MKRTIIYMIVALGVGSGCATGSQATTGPCVWSWEGSLGSATHVEGEGKCYVPEGVPVPGPEAPVVHLKCKASSPWVEQWLKQ